MAKSIFINMFAVVFAFGFYSCNEPGDSDLLSSKGSVLSLESDLAKLQADNDLSIYRLGFMAGILVLNDTQKEQIKGVIVEKMENRRERFRGRKDRSERPSREERKAMRKERHEEMIAAIMPILTPEQQAIVNEIKAARDRGEVPQILIDKRVEKMAEKLSLTVDQQAQLKTLFTESGQKMLAAKSEDGDRRANREAIKALREMTDAQIKTLLTPEQQETYEALKAERRESFRNHARKFGQRRMERRLEHLTAELELNADQQTQLKTIFEDSRENIRQKFEAGDSDHESRRETIRRHFEEIDTQIENILTESQLKKYQTIKADRKEKFRGHFGHE